MFFVLDDGVIVGYRNCGHSFRQGKRMADKPGPYSRKAAKRVLFWLEKNHWAREELYLVRDWLKEGMEMYLESNNEFIDCCIPHMKVWVRYEDYLERLGQYIARREQREREKGPAAFA